MPYSADALVFTSKKSDHSGSTTSSWSADVVLDNDGDPRLENIAPLKNRVFDLASLTKPMVTSLLLVEESIKENAHSLLDWAQNFKVVSVLPEFRGTLLESISLLDLWNHKAGLPPVVDLSPARPDFVSLGDRSKAQAALIAQIKLSIAQLKVVKSPVTQYSDVGYLILGLILERKNNSSLDVLWGDWQKVHSSKPFPRFHVDHVSDRECLSTGERFEAGIVNDDKAFFLGGVAPHAGLFGTVTEVSNWIECVLGLMKTKPLYEQWLTHSFAGRFCFGWDTGSSKPLSHAGQNASSSVRGHLGFTGTAFWIDPKSGQFGLLLTNRTHPQHTVITQKSIQLLRSRFFESLWQGTIYLG